MIDLCKGTLACLVLGVLVAACGASSKRSGDQDGEGGKGSSSTSSSGTGAQGGLALSSSSGEGGGGILKTEPPCEGDHTNLDDDKDGFTGGQGDCNDCTKQMNPGALDYAGNNIDEDCNGAPDDTPTNCDGALAVESQDPMDGARAMGLCKQAGGTGWGVVSAKYSKADGSPGQDPLGNGILSGFGPMVHPQEGAKVFAVSSGAARQPTDPNYQDPGGYDKGYVSGCPAGYPKEFPGCPGVVTGEPHDSHALTLKIRTPTNAKSLRFAFDFYTWEFPVYICSMFNDYFVAMLSPKLANLPDGNISFDKQGNTISVNAGFLEVCAPQQAGGKNFPCELGPAALGGTGFEEHAATGWLETSAPVDSPGSEIELMFAAWDSGDGILDSTVVIDDFRFEVEETPTGTVHIPDPK
ncbi:MAG: choice-of-anchor L domain-containing protein [Deltaproteobacteria bacterium]|nr:choice-of-anchor L domain-containing protein [Deltaproteobacteria bacterium]